MFSHTNKDAEFRSVATRNAVVVHSYREGDPYHPGGTREITQIVGVIHQEPGEDDQSFDGRVRKTLEDMRARTFKDILPPGDPLVASVGDRPAYSGTLHVDAAPTLGERLAGILASEKA